MLDTQYRMHPSISSFPAAEFYRGTVRDGTVDESGRVSKELEQQLREVEEERKEAVKEKREILRRLDERIVGVKIP